MTNTERVVTCILLVIAPTVTDAQKLGQCGSTYAQRLGLVDSYGEARFGPYCEAHDVCYESCGKLKKDCDKQFHDNLRQECMGTYTGQYYGIQRSACLELADAYYSVVTQLGGAAYQRAQSACVGTD